MALETSYGPTPTGSGGFGGGSSSTSGPDDKDTKYWPLSKLRRCYTDYIFSKSQEIQEQIQSRRYYHGTQWTAEQLAEMKKRKQPAMTFNRVQRKIDGVCGLIERLRQDPKAYPRTPQHEQGAELATAALRYVLDEQEWKAKSPQAAQDGAIDGIGGIEIELQQGDRGDVEVGFELVDVASFFYDPRSYFMDFDDSRYLGVGKWIDTDIAKEMFPDADVGAFSGNDFELINNSDKEMRWFASTGAIPRVRIVDIWYRMQGGWCWAIFTGNTILMEGKSYLKNEKGKDISKYVMFSGNVDQDGDRYGFVRNMRSAQDGINAKQSKMQHILASKRLILSQGAVADVEVVRREWAKPDGVIVTNRPVNEGVKADDQSFDFTGMAKMLELNLAEIENFGPNPALIGQGIENKSGRAIQLLQQAGMAELGPYILAYRGWKIRVYRALWNAVQQHWKAERWIRVTDDMGVAQFVQLNGMGIDPQTGMPAIINAVGSLDVDIILDEGPDELNMAADSYSVLQGLGPQFAIQFPEIALQLSPIQASVKKQMLDKLEAAKQAPPPPDPKVQALQTQSQLKIAEMQQGAQLEQQKTVAELAAKEREAEINAQSQERQAALDAQIKVTLAQQQMELRAAESNQDMAIKQRQHEMDMAHEMQRSEHKLGLETALGQIRLNLSGGSNGKEESKKSNGNDGSDVAKSAIDAMGKLGEGFNGLANIMAAPKRAVYGKDGRIAGSEIAK